MIRLADTNVVFAILVGHHGHHTRAWRWWERRDEASVGLCLPVRLGTLRLLTNATAMEGGPVSPEEALAAWDSFADDPRTVGLPLPGGPHELHFRRLIRGRATAPNLWTDAWLAAFAESTGMGLTSFDAGFRSFGLKDFELLRG